MTLDLVYQVNLGPAAGEHHVPACPALILELGLTMFGSPAPAILLLLAVSAHSLNLAYNIVRFINDV